MLIQTFYFQIGGSIHGYLLSQNQDFWIIEVMTDFHSEGIYLYPSSIFEKKEQTKLDIFHDYLLKKQGFTPYTHTINLTEADSWIDIFEYYRRSGSIIGIEGKADTELYELGIIVEVDTSGVSMRVFNEFGIWQDTIVYILFTDIFTLMIQNEYQDVLSNYISQKSEP